VILIPELPYTIDGIIKKLNEMKKQNIHHSLIVVAEAVKTEQGETYMIHYADGERRLGGIGDYLAEQIMKKSDIECRVTTLGHVQRGARPTANDRILASAFGVHAVNTYKVVDQNEGLVDTAFALGIYIGATDTPTISSN
jgi:6-phosphofructokinase 1